MISSKLRQSILKILGVCSKGKKLSTTATLNHVADPSTNVDRSVDSSVLTTLTREVNINTTTLQAAVSTTLDVFTTLDVLPSVPELGNTAKTEDSVSTTETAISTTLDASYSVPEEGKQATDNKKPAPVGQPFQPIDPKFDSRLRSFSNGKK